MPSGNFNRSGVTILSTSSQWSSPTIGRVQTPINMKSAVRYAVYVECDQEGRLVVPRRNHIELLDEIQRGCEKLAKACHEMQAVPPGDGEMLLDDVNRIRSLYVDMAVEIRDLGRVFE